MTTLNDIPLDRLEGVLSDQPVYYETRCNHCHYSQDCILVEEADLRARTHEKATDHECDILTVALCGDPPEDLGFVEVDKTATQDQ